MHLPLPTFEAHISEISIEFGANKTESDSIEVQVNNGDVTEFECREGTFKWQLKNVVVPYGGSLNIRYGSLRHVFKQIFNSNSDSRWVNFAFYDSMIGSEVSWKEGGNKYIVTSTLRAKNLNPEPLLEYFVKNISDNTLFKEIVKDLPCVLDSYAPPNLLPVWKDIEKFSGDLSKSVARALLASYIILRNETEVKGDLSDLVEEMRSSLKCMKNFRDVKHLKALKSTVWGIIEAVLESANLANANLAKSRQIINFRDQLGNCQSKLRGLKATVNASLEFMKIVDEAKGIRVEKGGTPEEKKYLRDAFLNKIAGERQGLPSAAI